MRAIFYATTMFLGVIHGGQAQCTDDSKAPKDYKVQYCHTNQNFEGYTAYFNEREPHFYLQTGKKQRKLSYGARDNDYLLALVRDRSLKLSAEDLLFVQDALSSWAQESRKVGYTFLKSGLGVKIVSKGDGPLPKKGESVSVHYAGYLEDGKKFDSSYDRGEPIAFKLGVGQVIKGWDEGIATLPKGTKAFLYIPSTLGYGARSQGGIPANSTLIFQVEVQN